MPRNREPGCSRQSKNQDRSGSVSGTEDHHDRADRAAYQHGGAEDHQSQIADPHGGADRAGAHQCGAEKAEDLHGGAHQGVADGTGAHQVRADGAEAPGRDWNLEYLSVADRT